MIEFGLSVSRFQQRMDEIYPSTPLPPDARTVTRGCVGRSSAEPPRKGNGRARDRGGGGGDQVRCTGRHCRSCTGGVVADCVAICCCPCAAVNCLMLAFVKVSYLIGKRWCTGSRKTRKRKPAGRDGGRGEGNRGSETKSSNAGCCAGDDDSWFEMGFEERMSAGRMSDAEIVWVELCEELNHLSFGRVSFAGFPLPTNVRLES